MIAAVLHRATLGRRRLATAGKPIAIICGAATMFVTSPASAQVNTAISLFNDYRFRGYSLSGGRPAAILDLSYDARSGLYAAVSGSILASHGEGLKPLGLVVNGGYATSVSPEIGLDVGITRSSYSRYSDRAAGLSYTEAYVGIAGKLLSARLNLSPDYVQGGSAYAELNGSWSLGTKLTLAAHAGVIVPFERTGPRYGYRKDVDWRLGLVRQVGPLSLQAAWTAVRPGRRAYRQRSHRRDALILGLTYSL